MYERHDAPTTNPYMAMRAAKIARNEARLRELGLLNSNSPKAIIRSRKKEMVRKQKKDGELEIGPRRRSARISSLANTPNYEDQ